MNKLVNIYPSMPITSLRIPLRTRVTNIRMDCESIRKCIIANAIVEEVLDDNSVIRLNLSNYNKNKVEEKHDNAKKEGKLSTHEVKVDEATIISAEDAKTDLSAKEQSEVTEEKVQSDKNQNVNNKQQNAKKEEVKKVRPNNNK